MAARKKSGRRERVEPAAQRSGAGAPDPEEAEVIGAQLWAAFAHGAGVSRIPPEVVRLGRRLSGPHVRANLHALLDEPGLLERTLLCAERVGALARARAPETHPPTVDEIAFADAWQEISEDQKRALERLRRVFGTQRALGGAC